MHKFAAMTTLFAALSVPVIAQHREEQSGPIKPDDVKITKAKYKGYEKQYKGADEYTCFVSVYNGRRHIDYSAKFIDSPEAKEKKGGKDLIIAWTNYLALYGPNFLDKTFEINGQGMNKEAAIDAMKKACANGDAPDQQIKKEIYPAYQDEPKP